MREGSPSTGPTLPDDALPSYATMTATVVAIFAIVYLGMIVGSIVNLIVVDAARRSGLEINWRRHARIGVPVTLAITAAWFVWRGAPSP